MLRPRIFPVANVFQMHISSTAIPYCVILCPASDTAAISSPHSLLQPPLLPLPIGGSLSCHPFPVRCLEMGPRLLAWVVDHDKCLPDISPQAHPIKQADQGTKCTLELLWV